jgi:GT2 family glycosyltransferase
MKASVIVLTWNGASYLTPCLEAVFGQDYPEFEVLVVDNGSTDGSAQLVTTCFPAARLIRHDQNMGFAAGMNAGLRAATGDPLVILNQDTVVGCSWLRRLALALGHDAKAGIAGGKAHYPDGRIQHAGGVMDRRGQGSHLGHRLPDTGQYDVAREVDFVTGAALAITRDCLQRVGELDQGFMLGYFEDVDWCYRARRFGASVIYVPSAEYVHAEASTSSGHSTDALYRYHRNRMRFVLKHWPIDRLLDDFGQAEYEWLDGLPFGEEPLIAAMQRVHLQYLLRPGDMVTWRQQWFDEPPNQYAKISRLLMELRALTLLKAPPPTLARLASASSQPSVQLEAQTPTRPPPHWLLREYQFRSKVPIVGPLIDGFRRLCASFASIWIIRSMMAQQNVINRHLSESMEVLSQRLALLEAEALTANFENADDFEARSNSAPGRPRPELERVPGQGDKSPDGSTVKIA